MRILMSQGCYIIETQQTYVFTHIVTETHTQTHDIQLHWGQYASVSLSLSVFQVRAHTYICIAEKITTTHCNALQNTATVILQYIVIHYNTFNEGSDDSRSSFAEEITATHCNALQHSNTLQHAATHSLQHTL